MFVAVAGLLAKTINGFRKPLLATLVLATAAMPLKAKADLLQYSYSGPTYDTYYSPPGQEAANPLRGGNNSGSIVIDVGSGLTTAPYQLYTIQNLSFSGGITSYSGPSISAGTPGLNGGEGGYVTVNPTGQIVGWSVTVSKGDYGISGDSSAASSYGGIANGVASGYDDAGIFKGLGTQTGTQFGAQVNSVGIWSEPTVVGSSGGGSGSGSTGSGGTTGTEGSGGTGGTGSSGGGSGGTGSANPAACAVDLKDAVRVFLSYDQSNLSITGEPTTILAKFQPKGVSLDQAATDCNVKEFNWEQKITNLPSPSPFFMKSDGSNLTAPPSFSDPVKGGYTYPLECQDGSISKDIDTAYPFFYAVNGSKADCWSLQFPDRHIDGALTFSDKPGDPCLRLGILSDRCSGSATGFLGFFTRLVGVDKNGNLIDLQELGYVSPKDDQFRWIDTYNGCVLAICTGSISLQLAGDTTLDGNQGSGGITILEINGVAVAEPSTIYLVMTLMLIFVASIFNKKNCTSKV